MNRLNAYLRNLAMAFSCTALALQLPPPLPMELPQPLRQESGATVWPGPHAPVIRFVAAVAGSEPAGGRLALLQRIGRAVFARPRTRMSRPAALAARNQVLYVADPGAGALLILDLRRNSFQSITRTGAGPLSSPVGVAMVREEVFVTDSQLGRVFVFDRRGRWLRQFGQGELHRPTGIAFDPAAGKLYIADTTAHRVLVYRPDGRLEFSFGRRGTGPGELNYPAHLWWSAGGGRIFVADSLNYRVQVFRADGSFAAEFGRHGDGSGDFASPKGIATDSRGHVYVVDALFDAVQIFDPRGQLLLSFGERGVRASQFWLPSGMFIDEQDHIYVADSHNHRVQIFEFLGRPNGG